MRLALALEGSRLGAWDWKPGEDAATVSRRWREIVGMDGAGQTSRIPTREWFARIHPDDRSRVEAALHGASIGREPGFDLEYRVAGRDGGWRWVRGRATAVERDGSGVVRRVAGTLADVHERKESERAAADREQRLRAYVNSPAVGVAITSPDKGWIEVNDRLCAMLGYGRDELARMTWAELTHPEDLAADLAQFQRLVAGEIDSYALDKRFLRRDGTPLWTLLSVSCARRSDRSVDYFVAILMDIGERKRAEEALRQSEDRFRTYVETAPIGIFVTDDQGRYRDFNQAALDLVGADPATLRAMTIADMVEEEDRPAALAEFGSLVATGHLERDYRLRRIGGGHVWVSLRAVRLGDGGFMAFCQDITARKASEQATRERERYLHTVLDTALDGFWAIDGEGRIVDVNPSYCAMTGYSRDELLTMRVADVEAGETPAEAAAHIRRIRTQGFDRFTSCHRRKDGSLVHVLVSARFVDLGPGLNVCFFHDVTERDRAEQALRESELRYRTLVTGMASGLVLQTADGAIVDSNPAAERLLGLTSDEMRGRTSLDPRWRALREDGSPFPGEELPPMVALRTGATQADRTLAIHRPDGEVAWLSVTAQSLRDESGRVHAVLSTFVDVTERRAAEAERARLQAQLAHAARLAAMGTLVAGVAHEINNPLSALMSNSGTALEEVREIRGAVAAGGGSPRPDLDGRFDELQEMLGDAGTAARRVADIVRDLTILGRPDQAKQPIDLGAVVRRAIDRLPPSVTRRAQVECALEPVAPVAASAGQMEQVLANLVGNAALSAPADRTVNVQVRLREGPGET
ncbi:MAG TPA: PAS domain S-box protein, partial [Anaeromyxobacteraceae bacterium]|nr:PAS domain S-box protein [Anaeromyxobacteraceae bacterium]